MTGACLSRSRACRRVGLLVVLCCIFLTAGPGVALDMPVVFVQEPKLFDAQARRAYPGAPLSGSRIVTLSPDGAFLELTDAFASAADPCVSFDGEQILFSAQENEGDPWDIWEMPVVGGSAVRITQGLGDCREPAYLPLAAVDSPNFSNKVRWITFTSTAAGMLNDQADGPLTSLYAMSLVPLYGRGTVLWRTTLNLGGDIDPTVLHSDGRVLFAGRQRGAYGLMSISWAGENLNTFFGSHTGDVSQVSPCEMPDRTVVFIETSDSHSDGGGHLVRVSLRRPLHSREVLNGDHARYRTPHPLADGRMLVSRSAGGSTFGVYALDHGAGLACELVYDDPEWHEVDAQAVAVQPEPPGRIPTVEFASVLDVGALKTVGQLQCLNVYDTNRPWPDYQAGQSVTHVRLVEGIPLEQTGAAFTTADPDTAWPPRGVQTRVLGEAAVEADGSFYVNVAGDVPFYMQVLDTTGRALQTMRAWTWVRAGDQRGCIGCHEDKELAPENRATEALVRARPAFLAVPPEERASYTFVNDVWPVVAQRCLGCHSGPESGLDLTGASANDSLRAYARLLGLAASPEPDAAGEPVGASRRRLVEMLGSEGGHGGVTEAERRRLFAWMDLGARWEAQKETQAARSGAMGGD